MGSIAERLSTHERRLRDDCIERVQRGLNGLQDAADALLELREGRLYRETHRTWAIFCRETFGLTKQHVDRKIAAAEVLSLLESSHSQNGTSDVPFLPTSEAQVIELAPIPREKQPEVWRACVERSGGKQPTLREVRSMVSEVLGRKPVSETNPAQHDREAIRRALVFLRSVTSPSENTTAAIDLLCRDIDRGGENSSSQKTTTE